MRSYVPILPRRTTLDEEGHLGYLPAGICLDDLLRAAEEIQSHLPTPGGSSATTPTATVAAAAAGGLREGEEYTPLDLAALVAAHARHMKQQQVGRTWGQGGAG